METPRRIYIYMYEMEASEYFQCLLSSQNVIAVLREKMNNWYFIPRTLYTLPLLSGGGGATKKVSTYLGLVQKFIKLKYLTKITIKPQKSDHKIIQIS